MAVIKETTGLSFDDVLIVPRHSKLTSRKDADLSTVLACGTREISSDYGYYTRPKENPLKLDIPIVSANMPSVTEGKMARAIRSMGGFGFLHRFNTIEGNVELFQKAGGAAGIAFGHPPNNAVGVSLGLKMGLERYRALYEAGARTFLVDVAHADSEAVTKFVRELIREDRELSYIIVGNVATKEGVRELESLGVDAIKVGIGPGAACTTREVTGAGRAQLTAIMECAAVANVPLIADGGIRNSGDIVKALAAGASTVMLGRLLAGCDESPVPGSYWGNASARMNGHRAPEGTEGNVARTGSLEDTLKPLLWGLRSGISYAGATSVRDLAAAAVFERTAAGVAAESGVRI